MNDLAARIVDVMACAMANAIILTERDRELLAEVVREVLSDDARARAKEHDLARGFARTAR